MIKKINLSLLIIFCLFFACNSVQANSGVVTQSLTVGDEIPEIKENITKTITEPDIPVNTYVDEPTSEAYYYPEIYNPPVYRRQVTRYEFYPNGGMYYGGYGYTSGYSGRGMTVYTNPYGGYNFGGETLYRGPIPQIRPPQHQGGFAPPPPPPNNRRPGGKPHGPHGGFKGGVMF